MPNFIHHKITLYLKRSYQSKDIIYLAFIFLCFNLTVNIIAYLAGFAYPHTSFLLDPNDRFGDFFKVIDALNIVKTWNGIIGEVNVYSRPVSSIYYLFFAKLIVYTGNKYLVYGLLCFVAIILIFLVSRIPGNTFRSILLVILSYPMLFAMDRGNFAIVVFLLLLAAFVTNNILLSTLFIALASSLKLTPIIFLLPLLSKTSFTIWNTVKIISLTIIWILIVNYFSLGVLTRTFTQEGDSLSQFNDEINYYYNIMIGGLSGLGYGSSMYMPLVWLAYRLHAKTYFLSHIKPIVLPIITFGSVGLLWIIKGDVRNRVIKMFEYDKLIFVLSMSFVLFMPVTADYYLLILFLPLLLFPNSNYSFGYFFIYGLLMGAKNIFFLGQVLGTSGLYLSLQVFLNPILLLILLVAEFDLIRFIRRNSTTWSLPDAPKTKTLVPLIALVTGAIVIVCASHFYSFSKRQEYNLSADLPADFDPAIFLGVHPGLAEYWRTQEEMDSDQKLQNRAEEFCRVHGGKAGWNQYLFNKKTHNIALSLPIDFDAATYLTLNPGVRESFRSLSLNESDQSLLERAEVHYQFYGYKERLKYK